MNNNKGFTLVEILVALGITMIILAAIYMAVNASQKTSSGIERRVLAQQDEKAALQIMEMEIRMASYNPEFVYANLWKSPSNCNDFSNQAYKGIPVAEANALAIEMDLNGNKSVGVSALGDTSEIIYYNYDTANQRITRETQCGGAQSLLGSNTAGQKSVKVINSILGIPIFRYFDVSGTELAVPVTGDIPNIRRGDIFLAVETEYPNPSTGQPSRIVYSTSVLLRNHAPLP